MKALAAVPRETPTSPTTAFEEVLLELVDLGDNPRIDPGELEGLTASILELGVLDPVKVTAQPDGRYRLVWGQRRVLASRLAGKLRIPALVESAGVLDVKGGRRSIEQLSENLQRKDMNPIEEAVALREVLDGDPGLTQEALADRLGRSRPWLSNTLRLLGVDVVVQIKVRAGEISATHARAIATLPPKQQKELATRAVNSKWTSRDLENEIKWKQDAALQDEHKAKKTARWIPKAIAALEAAGVSKDALIHLSGGSYDVDHDAVRRAIQKAGWKKWSDGYLLERPEKGCDCTAISLEVGGRKAEITGVCSDRRHGDREVNQKHVEERAASDLRATHSRQLLDAVAPLVAAIPTAILRPIVFLVERSSGRYLPWEKVETMDATALQSFLVDQLVGGGGGSWGRSGVDLAFVLRELGVEPAETPTSGDA